MTDQHQKWVENNMLLFTTSRRYTEEEYRMIFEIVSNVTNTPTKVTKCGRCVTNAKNTILHHYYEKTRNNN